jgi:hypothetical protein
MGKIQLVTSLFLFFVGTVVSYLERLISGTAKKNQTIDILEIEPGRIWQFTYTMRGHSSNCVIIKGSDGKLLLRSPPPFDIPGSLHIINKLGEPGVILASLAHDTFIDQWKQKFPEVKVISGRADLDVISDRVKVDVSIENSGKLLENYFIVKVLPTMFTRYEDQYLVVQIPGTQNICLMPCGYANNNHGGLGGYIMGAHGLTFMRVFAHMFAANPSNADRQTRQIISEFPDMKAFVFLHGSPLAGPDASEKMLKIHAGGARNLTFFGC